MISSGTRVSVLERSGEREPRRTLVIYLKIVDFFNYGIYGSPSTKSEILEKLKGENKIKKPALFFGDSKLDHITAELFVSQSLISLTFMLSVLIFFDSSL